MAKQVEWGQAGVDVSKAELAVCRQDVGGVQVISNERRAIRDWVKALPGPMRIAVEATNTYHLALVEEAHAKGHRVYVIDGYRLNRYRESIGGRAKTDRTDAQLLLRYLDREGKDLRPWTPPSAGYVQLQRLLHRRARLVQAKVSLTQSLTDIPELKSSSRSLIRRLDHVDLLIRKRIARLLAGTDTGRDARRCQAIEGIGPVTGAALANAFRRGAFRSSDAFIAFFGMDVRVRESGKHRGRRKLTKQGDPELRRLVYLAAMTACRSVRWEPVYQRYLARGLKPAQALVALARKLTRVAFALMKNQSEYRSAPPLPA